MSSHAQVAPRPLGPKGLPVVGSLIEFRKNPLEFLQRIARQYGDLVYFKLGPQHAFLINDPELIQEVLVVQQSNFVKSRGLQRARVLLGDGLLTSEGEFHLKQRRLIQPAFHRDRLREYAKVMGEFTLRTSSRWQAGMDIEVWHEMMELTLAVVCKTLFSADVEAAGSEIGPALTSVFKMLSMLMMPFSEYLEKLPLPSVRRFIKSRRILDETIYRIIEEHRQRGTDCGDLLSTLLLAQDEDSGKMSNAQVRDEVLTLFLAGHETTANALTWAWYLLSQNPECEQRLHQEIDSLLGGRTPGFDDLPQLKYTEMVFAETVRLYPPAWAIGRIALKPFKLGAIEIPAGGVCIASPYVMQRDPRYFPEPERFLPERWTPSQKEARPKFSYFPFGGGARVCLGERFAWVEGMLILATIAQRWRLRFVPGQQIKPLPVINTLRMTNGVHMLLEPRKSADSAHGS